MNNAHVKIRDVKNNETVFDPACGIGGFAVELAKRFYPKNSDNESMFNFEFHGQEIQKTIAKICKMNVILNGLDDFRIMNTDSLKYPATPDIKFNKITISLIVYNSFKLYPNIWVNIPKTIINHCKQNGK